MVYSIVMHTPASTQGHNQLKSIAVYCGSSLGLSPHYTAAAAQIGHSLATQGITLVYGGGKAGLMGQVAQAALDAGGHVIGVIPQRLMNKEAAHTGLTELHIVPDMHVRKAMMIDKSDGFITLPGGVGTYEELFEVWAWLQLGYHRKPIGLFNVDGYFDPLLGMMQHTVAQGFMRSENNDQLLVGDSLEGLLQQMRDFTAMDSDAWLDSKY